MRILWREVGKRVKEEGTGLICLFETPPPANCLRFLQDIQDDNLTLNMELNMTIQKAAKVQAENKELVDRWMKRMGHEADALNLQNESPNKHHR